ncbi:hypothetical protein [Bacillus sp. SM2101]|uniref:hypothetical protein n=1 Tax=Bacillus sp. SM2101 TaxID=2805366 RepID=UPI001BDE985E|nr:hypothetical protein [Bacillus sp. SM2101]
MSSKEPKFMKSPYFNEKPGNWQLKPGAPEEVKKEFEEFMEYDEPGNLDEPKKIE